MVMNLIADAGSSKSYSMQAIAYAREGKFEAAKIAMNQSEEEITKAHALQTDLIQNEAKGDKTEMDLYMVHAQDHVMTAILAKEMAVEIVELYQRLEKQ